MSCWRRTWPSGTWGGVPLTRENYERLLERIDVYLDEFDAHGTDHVSVELEEP